MRKQILTLMTAGIMLAGSAHAQLQRIVLQGNGAPTVHTDLATALAAAQPNDKVYFSGGTFIAPGPLVIDKPLHFIGAGIHPDSSAVTTTTTMRTTGNSVAHIVITTAASGSSFTGIIFEPSSAGANLYFGSTAADDDPVGVVFQRCKFVRRVYLGVQDGSTSQSSFDECVFNSDLYGNGGTATITRSIFDGGSINIFRPGGLTLKNSVLLNIQVQNSNNAIIQNCAFTYNGAAMYQMRGTQVSNCIISGATMFGNSAGNGNVETNNIYGVPGATMFVNQTNNTYEFTDDLNMAGPGIGGGNDGTDIGIYGTHSPYKSGAVPYNPHYRAADISPATNGLGHLPVNIRTAAQTH